MLLRPSGNSGIHAYFETMVIGNEMTVRIYKDLILKNDTQYGRSAKGAAIQLELAKDRMVDGAATLAMILSQLWKDSHLVAMATPMTINDPAWVPLDFSQI